jgi:hypothetical protein
MVTMADWRIPLGSYIGTFHVEASFEGPLLTEKRK